VFICGNLRCRFWVAATSIVLLCLTTMCAEEPEYYSPEAMVAFHDGRLLYVAEKTAKQVAVVDLNAGKVVKAFRLPGEPSGMALGPDGNSLFVTVEGVDGRVVQLDPNSGEITATIPAGHTPMAPVLSPDAKMLYVCNRFNNEVIVIDVDSKKQTARIPVGREPVAAVLSRDGRHLFVANHLPAGASNQSRVTAAVDVIDTASGKVDASISLPNGSVALRGMCLSLDGKIVYVTSTLGRFMLATTTVARGWMNTCVLHLIDAEKRSLRYTVPLDEESLGAANPWGVACSADGKFVCVAHSGTHEVSIIDQQALLAKLAKVPPQNESGITEEAYEKLPENPADDLNFLAGIRKRVQLKGNGPRGVAIMSGTLYAAEYFSGSVGAVGLDSAAHPVKSIALGAERPKSLKRKGEMLFHDAATMCFQQWQSCSSCHPDGRTDALNWDLLNDGMGNSKNTKSLLFSAQTPPVMARGVRTSASVAVRTGMKFIQFTEPADEKADALHEYIKSLAPIPSPILFNGELSTGARRGESVFRRANCAACHSGQYFTDLKLHNVGTGAGMEAGVWFDTPTLRELWRTAPYLHDGRAATLEEVVTKFNPSDRHGKTSELSPQEVADLVEYLKSL